MRAAFEDVVAGDKLEEKSMKATMPETWFPHLPLVSVELFLIFGCAAIGV